MTFTRDPVLERSSIGIPTLIDDAIEIAFTGLDGVVPVIDRAGEAELEVFVDRHAFTQVLVNLIDNARRVMEQCGALDEEGPHIAIAWGRTAGLIDPVTWIEVADRGPGIPENEVERLRRPFTRLEKARTNTKGAGLGLAIVERIMRGHHGRLDLLPREGGGLRAVLCLPVAAASGGSDRMRRPASGTPRKS